MGARWRRRLCAAAAAVTLSGCATPGGELAGGVYRAPARFRLTLPGAAWTVARATPSELELRHSAARAGILAHVECGSDAARRELPLLVRRLFVGLTARETLANGVATLGGLPAVHAVLEAEVTGGDERMRVEAYVAKDDRCVYDLVYVAPSAAHAERRGDFQRVVESFARE